MKIGKINKLSIVKNGYVLPLKNIPSPPLTLYCAGSLPAKRRPTIAIIGSRKPTPYGREVTHSIAHKLAKHGVVIVSGLALGIDAIAHKAALEAGGTTIAVLANGLHRVYPPSHAGLAKEIVEAGGALVSEKPLGYEARPYDFLARNRLVSGLADAILVTEATERSGTLSTVTHALEQNKEVFAIPGPITSLLSVGPNKLMQQGAHPVVCAEDILRVIAPELEIGQKQFVFGDTPLEVKLLELLGAGVRDGNALQQQAGVPASEFLQALTMMELKGTIRALGGNQWSIGT